MFVQKQRAGFVTTCLLLPIVLAAGSSLVRASDNADQFRVLTERGQANGLLMQQKLDEALDILLRHRREAKTPHEQGEADFHIGYAYFYMGDDRQAARYYEAGLSQMTEAGYLRHSGNFASMYPYVLSNADNRHKFAYALFRMGKLKAAAGVLEPLRQSLEQFLKTNQDAAARSTAHLSLIRVLNTFGLVQKRLGDAAAARESFTRMGDVCRQALAEQQQQQNRPGATITLHFRHSQALHETGRNEEALAAVDRCLAEVRQAWGDKVGKTTAESYYHLHRARILEVLKRTADALQSAEQALQVAEADAMSNWSQPEAACQVAELHRQLQNWDQAEAAYRRALRTIEEIYISAQQTGLREDFLESKIAVFSRLSSLLAERGRWEESFKIAEAGRSRALLDMLGNAPARETGAASLSPELLEQDRKFAAQMRDLSSKAQAAAWNPAIDTRAARQEYRRLQGEYDRFRNTLALEHPGYAVFQTIQTVDEKELQQLYAGNPALAQSALLSYVLCDDAVIGFCFDGVRLHGKVLSQNSAGLHASINELRSAIASQDGNWRAPAVRLHETLIKPFVPHLEGKTKLLIVPHQSLHFLPFTVLCDDSHRLLIEQYEICTVPSASILKLWSQRPGESAASSAEAHAVIVANPDGSLPFSEREVESVRRAFPRAESLIGDAAQEDAVLERIAGADVLHIASHGLTNPLRPAYSHLRLAKPSGELGAADGLLDVHEIVRRLDARRTRLVVLSACETAMGPASRGDEVQSLANAFLCAGAHEVIATLWSVDDRATAELMDDFYAALRDGIAPASALRAAMLVRVAAGKHPYEWAAFQVLGNR
jgi:CHAT domain-containing protein